jgi:hypothetical protein
MPSPKTKGVRTKNDVAHLRKILEQLTTAIEFIEANGDSNTSVSGSTVELTPSYFDDPFQGDDSLDELCPLRRSAFASDTIENITVEKVNSDYSDPPMKRAKENMARWEDWADNTPKEVKTASVEAEFCQNCFTACDSCCPYHAFDMEEKSSCSEWDTRSDKDNTLATSELASSLDGPAFQSPPEPPKKINVTYWATVQNGVSEYYIPLKAGDVSGFEKEVVTTSMAKVWEWVHSRGLTNTISLKDAYDLAVSIHKKEEPMNIAWNMADDVKFFTEDSSPKVPEAPPSGGACDGRDCKDANCANQDTRSTGRSDWGWGRARNSDDESNRSRRSGAW